MSERADTHLEIITDLNARVDILQGQLLAAVRDCDEARQVARGCDDMLLEFDVLDEILPGGEDWERERYGRKCQIEAWRELLPWLTEGPTP